MNKPESNKKLYSMFHVLSRLSSLGFAVTSRPTYIKYEKQGIFKPGRFSVAYEGRVERLFTKEEIEENIARFKAYKKGSLQ